MGIKMSKVEAFNKADVSFRVKTPISISILKFKKYDQLDHLPP